MAGDKMNKKTKRALNIIAWAVGVIAIIIALYGIIISLAK